MFYYFSYCCSIIFQDICKIKHFTSYEIFYLYFFVRISRFYLHLILNIPHRLATRNTEPRFLKYPASILKNKAAFSPHRRPHSFRSHTHVTEVGAFSNHRPPSDDFLPVR